jgi:hypothetical protein
MSDRPGLFAAPRHTVLSLSVEPESAIPERDRSQFEVLVRHLIYRFFHNELLASDDETRRVMLVSYTAALPSFVLTLFLYFIYHFALPPMPYPRPFWSQIGDHYFFVMYSFLIMGAAVYEWDLLFPDLLDVFVLSVLPISTRRLFFARVLALTIFLGAVLIGTSILGTLFFPVVADLPRFGYHLLAHALSVLMSGTFAAASFLALQGILLNTVGQRVFRRITPFLQGGSMMLVAGSAAVLSRGMSFHHAAADIRQHCGSLFSALLVPGRLRAHPARAVRTADLQPACPHRLQRADAHALDRATDLSACLPPTRPPAHRRGRCHR